MTARETDHLVAEPEKSLAWMVLVDLGIKIDPQALRMFVRSRWGTLRQLAHAIHGKEEDRQNWDLQEVMRINNAMRDLLNEALTKGAAGAKCVDLTCQNWTRRVREVVAP